jgi:hypothetical protein
MENHQDPAASASVLHQAQILMLPRNKAQKLFILLYKMLLIHGSLELINKLVLDLLQRMAEDQSHGIITIFQRVFQEITTELFLDLLDKLVFIVFLPQLETQEDLRLKLTIL